jgi:hypothetical protein
MELKQRYSEEINFKYDMLKNICKVVLGQDVETSRRTRNAVDARKYIAYILIASDYTLKQIGDVMDKDHTTIIYYLKTFEWMMTHDKATKRRYALVSDAFYNPIRDMKDAREQELLNEINLLQEQVKSLSLWKEKYFSDVNLFKRYKDFITELDTLHEKEFLVQKFTKAVRNFS